MLGKVRLFWIGAWIKQDKLWMEQGHARGFAFTAVAAALSGCSGMSPQLWTGRETNLALWDRLEKRGQGMGLLGTGTQSRNLAGSGHKEWSCQWEKCFHDLLDSAQLEAECPRQAGSKCCQAQTISHHAPAWVWGAAGQLCFPGILGHCQQQPLPLCRGLADTCSPTGEMALPHLDVPPRAWELPGPVLGEGTQLREG